MFLKLFLVILLHCSLTLDLFISLGVLSAVIVDARNLTPDQTRHVKQQLQQQQQCHMNFDSVVLFVFGVDE